MKEQTTQKQETSEKRDTNQKTRTTKLFVKSYTNNLDRYLYHQTHYKRLAIDTVKFQNKFRNENFDRDHAVYSIWGNGYLQFDMSICYIRGAKRIKAISCFLRSYRFDFDTVCVVSC